MSKKQERSESNSNIYETNHDYKYGLIPVVHTETKIKTPGFLKLDYNNFSEDGLQAQSA